MLCIKTKSTISNISFPTYGDTVPMTDRVWLQVQAMFKLSCSMMDIALALHQDTKGNVDSRHRFV